MTDVIDLEVYGKKGEKPPSATTYRIRIDKDFKDVTAVGLTGREILALVAKTPETHLLSMKVHEKGSRPIQADEFVDFTEQGIERFQTLARDATEG
jgi:hypothetical protein